MHSQPWVSLVSGLINLYFAAVSSCSAELELCEIFIEINLNYLIKTSTYKSWHGLELVIRIYNFFRIFNVRQILGFCEENKNLWSRRKILGFFYVDNLGWKVQFPPFEKLKYLCFWRHEKKMTWKVSTLSGSFLTLACWKYLLETIFMWEVYIELQDFTYLEILLNDGGNFLANRMA